MIKPSQESRLPCLLNVKSFCLCLSNVMGMDAIENDCLTLAQGLHTKHSNMSAAFCPFNASSGIESKGMKARSG